MTPQPTTEELHDMLTDTAALSHEDTMAMIAEATGRTPRLINTGGGCMAIRIPTPHGSALLTDEYDTYTECPQDADTGWCLGIYGADDEACYSQGTFISFSSPERTAEGLASVLVAARAHFTEARCPDCGNWVACNCG